MKYWLIKSEPFKYSWDQMCKDGVTFWDGVRSYGARIHLLAMKKGDTVLFYHSNEGLEIVGQVSVVKESYQDPTTEDDRWVVVDVKAEKSLKNSVKLSDIKANPKLKDIALVRQSRLSVMPLTKKEYEIIMEMAGE